MTDQGFPNSHTTTTVVHPTDNKSSVHLDLSYIHTRDGRIKCGEIALNLLGFICILCSYWSYDFTETWFNLVTMIGFWFSGIMLVFYFFHVPENLKMIPWIKVEFIFCALWSLFYLIASSLAASRASVDNAYAAAAFFGFCAMLLYGFDAYLKFNQLKKDTNSVRTGNMGQNMPPRDPTY